jgi:hypothetical protein
MFNLPIVRLLPEERRKFEAEARALRGRVGEFGEPNRQWVRGK